jgi:hypothetical protein
MYNENSFLYMLNILNELASALLSEGEVPGLDVGWAKSISSDNSCLWPTAASTY